MEYRDEFETRKDVFRVNVFHNKKNGEKVTMYFVPRTTPVNDKTVFDYCTKNKTWREKQAQKWCDEKSGKNKDRLESLPYIAKGLQKDVVAGTPSPIWKGDDLFKARDDYKRGLGMTVQPRNNNQTGGNQGFQDKLKSLASLGEKEIVQKFNELFRVGGDNWKTYSAGYNASGAELMHAELTIKGKDGKLKTYKTEKNGKIKPAVGKRSAQQNVILAFLAEEYEIGKSGEIISERKEEKPKARMEEFKEHIRENLRDEDCWQWFRDVPEEFGIESSWRIDPQKMVRRSDGGRIQVNSAILYLVHDGKQHSFEGIGRNQNSAKNTAILKMAKELCGFDLEEERKKEEERFRKEQEEKYKDSKEAKYYKTLRERPDITTKASEIWDDTFIYYLNTPYGQEEIGRSSEIPLSIIKSANVTDEEKKEINNQIDIKKTEILKRLEARAQFELKLQQEKEEKRRLQEAAQRTKELLANNKVSTIANMNISLVGKTRDENDHRAYLLQDENGEQYKLTVDYGDKKIIDRDHHLSPYEEGYGFLTDEVEHQHIEKPMRTLTVAYEKVGGKEDEKFAFSAAVEPEVYAKNPLSIDLVFEQNLKVAGFNRRNHPDTDAEKLGQIVLLQTLLRKSNDAVNFCRQTFKMKKESERWS